MKKIALLVFLLAISETASAVTVSVDPTISETNIFTVGEIVVTGKPQSKESVTAEEMEQLNKKNISQAVNILPGIYQGNMGARNEGMIYVRGFDMRQVPLYVDGIPQYVPYDGYVDPNRFTTFDLSEIIISKGYSSVLFGPNTLGGAINMVSRKPLKKFEGKVTGGLSFDNNQIASACTSLNLASNQGEWYVQSSLSLLDGNFIPLSGSFAATKNENGGKRDNSDTQDFKGSVKVGYTPNSTDEYSLSFINQDSNKGVPVYTGINPLAAVRYWRYTEWEKSSLYFIGKRQLDSKSYLKTRAFYDKYYNVLDSYDNATYTTQATKKSFTSIYDDKTVGGSVEYGTELIRNNTLKFAVHDKYDMHKEYNIGQQAKEFADNTFSVSAENTWSASDDFSVIVGVRRDFRNTNKAEDLQGTTLSSFDLRDNTATNYQLAVVARLDDRQSVTSYLTRTTRFPTQKDRYSYRFGSALPNPALQQEQSWNYGVDYSVKLVDNLKMQASVYQSKLSDVIQQVDNVLPGVYQFRNSGRATYTGFECSVDWQPVSWLKTFTAYSYIDRKNESNPSLLFTDVPHNKLSGYLQFFLDKSTWAMLESEYNSGRYSTSDGKYKAGAYAVANLRASTTLQNSISLQVSVENLFDRNYQVAEGYPEAGRQYVISGSYAF